VKVVSEKEFFGDTPAIDEEKYYEEPKGALPREVGELVVFGLVRSTKKISEVLPTFHVYRAVVSPDTHRIVEQDLSKQSYLLWEAQHMLEAGLTEEFDRLTDEKKRG
jgi:hypothetical protein